MLTVHKFTPVTEREGAAEIVSTDELLAQGKTLLRSVVGQEGRNVVAYHAERPTFAPSRTFTYNKTPPSVPCAKSTSAPLKEWGDLDNTEENAVLSELEEFRSVNVSHCLMEKRRKPKRRATDDTALEAPSKKRRKTDDSSLYGLIPKPHHHSYPRIVPKSLATEIVTKRFSPYSKSPIKPISPHTLETVETYLKQPFTRSAWIIPVCGHTPWEAASPAIIGPARSDQTIAWNPAMLREFWASLLILRERGVLGAISLSYHVPAAEETKGILRCTHIKIYHDVRFALYVRAVLDGWYPQVVVDGNEIAKTKMRPLLRKTLALVDERSIAVAVC